MEAQKAHSALSVVLERAIEIYVHRQRLIEAGVLEIVMKESGVRTPSDARVLKLIDPIRKCSLVFDRDVGGQYGVKEIGKFSLRMITQTLDDPLDEFSVGDEIGIHRVGTAPPADVEELQIWRVRHGARRSRPEITLSGGYTQKFCSPTVVVLDGKCGLRVSYKLESDALVVDKISDEATLTHSSLFMESSDAFPTSEDLFTKEGREKFMDGGREWSESFLKARREWANEYTLFKQRIQVTAGTLLVRDWLFPVEYLNFEAHAKPLCDNLTEIVKQITQRRTARNGPYR